jgi:hypothetical protein
MIYGHDKTIHGTEHVDVETDKHGKVVAVWFRCLLLPFEQSVVDTDRAAEMECSYRHEKPKGLVAVEVRE